MVKCRFTGVTMFADADVFMTRDVERSREPEVGTIIDLLETPVARDSPAIVTFDRLTIRRIIENDAMGILDVEILPRRHETNEARYRQWTQEVSEEYERLGWKIVAVSTHADAKRRGQQLSDELPLYDPPSNQAAFSPSSRRAWRSISGVRNVSLRTVIPLRGRRWMT